MKITKEFVEKNLEEIKKHLPADKAEEKKTGIAIKNRWTGSIIFQSSKTTWREAIEEASGKNINLTNADLTNADLTNADLTNADLTRANLTNANLTDADLTDADLTRANLTNANLTNANLTNANLTGCLYYFGYINRNFEALCRAIKTIRHPDGKYSDFNS